MRAGVDEAGRGPVLGPMVMAAYMGSVPEGVTDSKLLSKEKREEFYEVLIKQPHCIRICKPEEIDEWVNQGKLNYLEAEKTAEMLNELKPEIAFIDCPAKNMEAYKAYIAERAQGIKLHVQFKADLEHPEAAAASIIAKVTRDRIIEDIKKEVGFDFGSGYLTDPKTQAYLKVIPLDSVHIRKSWSTYKELVKKKEQQTLF